MTENNRMEQKNEVFATLFGRVKLENEHGCSIEAITRDPAHWLMMKYLLFSTTHAASLDELYQTVWEQDGFALSDTTFRSRVFRARELLAPLKLSGAKELLLREGELFRLNPDYVIRSDVEEFRELMARRRMIPPEDPEGLEVCIQALELFKAPIIQYTGASPWLEEVRGTLCAEYEALARDALERSGRLGDDRALALLAARAPLIVPKGAALHEEVMARLAEQDRQIELIGYRMSLAHAESGAAYAASRPRRREPAPAAEAVRRRPLGETAGRTRSVRV